MQAEQLAKRLESLGLEIPPAPKPVGSYVPAVRTGNLVFVSGQLPMRDGVLAYTGRVGEDVEVAQAQGAAQLCFLNALAALGSLPDCGPASIVRVVKLTGFVQCAQGFTQQSQVLNGASDLSHKLFGDAGVHSRAAVGVYALPLNAPVEVEAVFEVA